MSEFIFNLFSSLAEWVGKHVHKYGQNDAPQELHDYFADHANHGPLSHLSEHVHDLHL